MSRNSAAAAAGALLALIRTGEATSRPALERASGLSRVTLAQRLSHLFEAGLLIESEAEETSRGRPARRLHLNPNSAVVIAADVGESVTRVAITDLSPRVLAETTVEVDVTSGPQRILREIVRTGGKALKDAGKTPRQALGLGLSLPAPVDHAAGRVVGPSVMRGWDDVDIRARLGAELDVPAHVDNDVNLMALSEFRGFWPEAEHFLFIKAGTGIGSGLITHQKIYRGARGASGDIGHIQFDARDAPLCRCGKLGCVEARAAGWAIARDLRALGFSAENARDVIALLEGGEPDCIQRVREAGRVLGEVAADVVSVLNPSTIVIGGVLSRAGEHLLAGVRELIYRRCLPLALEGLSVFAARSDDRAGVLGAAHLVIDAELAPAALEGTIARVRRG
jgi:predicted NBD/HSP70 family sugar kinase